MTENIAQQRALKLVKLAYEHQLQHRFGDAIALYESSIMLHPTAEAHTYLGWTYAMMGYHEEAIEACKTAIEVDPEFGNPYNDIGAYLMELERYEEAIPWLEKAVDAPRYESVHVALLNLGRVYSRLGRARTALEYFDAAIDIEPFYRQAISAKYILIGRLN